MLEPLPLVPVQTTVLVASPDAPLVMDLERLLAASGLQVESVLDGGQALAAMMPLPTGSLILLDARMPGVASGRLLAAMQDEGLRRRCAVALIADQVTDEWIVRLRQGVIDDIVPRHADASAWRTHLSTMQRGHALYAELEYLRDTASMEIRHDRVTGCYDRETMLRFLFRETDRVQRLHSPLSVLVMDLDDFSHWNEEVGRDACDRVLREVAVRSSRVLRSYDLLGRLGKDAYLMVLPGCGTIDAGMLADRLRMEVFGEPFQVTEQNTCDRTPIEVRLRLSACFGIAASRSRSPVVVVREAEEALAQAKLAGPDNILCAGESSRQPTHAPALFPEPQIYAL